MRKSSLLFCFLSLLILSLTAWYIIENEDISEVLSYRADQGDLSAMNLLGTKYEYAEGVPQDLGKAFEWYEKAAMLGHAEAQFNLAGLYYWGDGRPRDLHKAHEWYEKAAMQGHAEAQFNLATMYDWGRGMPRDPVKAKEWYERSCKSGMTAGCARHHQYRRYDALYPVLP